jgi:hypothetical protein
MRVSRAYPIVQRSFPWPATRKLPLDSCPGSSYYRVSRPQVVSSCWGGSLMVVETVEEEEALIQNFVDRVPSSARYLAIENCEDITVELMSYLLQNNSLPGLPTL